MAYMLRPARLCPQVFTPVFSESSLEDYRVTMGAWRAIISAFTADPQLAAKKRIRITVLNPILYTIGNHGLDKARVSASSSPKPFPDPICKVLRRNVVPQASHQHQQHGRCIAPSNKPHSSRDVQVALESWEHLLRSYLPASEAPALTSAELTGDKLKLVEQQTDTDFIGPVIKLICCLVGEAVDKPTLRKGKMSYLQRLERCHLLGEVCLSACHPERDTCKLIHPSCDSCPLTLLCQSCLHCRPPLLRCIRSILSISIPKTGATLSVSR